MVFNKLSNNFINKQTILITGITGFLGKRIADHFINLGFLIIAPTRNNTNLNTTNSNLLICNYKNLKKILNKRRVDFIFHFAALTRVNHDDQDLIYKTNIELAKYIKTIADICKPKMIIFTSTISIYGEVYYPLIRFYSPINYAKIDSYGKSKLLAEKILSESCKDIGCRLITFRLPGIVGYGSHSNLISKLIRNFLSDSKEPIYLINPENSFNNVVDINTFISYLDLVVSPNYKSFEQINTLLACKEPITIKKVTQLIINGLGLDKSTNKRIIWQLSNSSSFTIDSNYQKQFLLEPISTTKCINNLCKDIINKGKI